MFSPSFSWTAYCKLLGLASLCEIALMLSAMVAETKWSDQTSGMLPAILVILSSSVTLFTCIFLLLSPFPPYPLLTACSALWLLVVYTLPFASDESKPDGILSRTSLMRIVAWVSLALCVGGGTARCIYVARHPGESDQSLRDQDRFGERMFVTSQSAAKILPMGKRLA